MNLNALKYFALFILSIYSLNAIKIYGQNENLKLNILSKNKSQTQLKLKTTYDFVGFNIIFLKIKNNRIKSANITKLKLSGRPDNNPFRIGGEFIFGANFEGNTKVIPGFLLFMDINLSKRIAFVKLEYGNLFEAEQEQSIKFTTLGLNYKIIKSKKNNLYIHGALMAFWNSKGGGGVGGGVTWFLSLRYKYSFDYYFAFVSSLRYPIGGFKSIMISIGIQIFND